MPGTDNLQEPGSSTEAILLCEAQRRDAMLAADAKRLAAIICDSVIYGHSTGQTDTKGAYIEKIASGSNVYRQLDLEPISAQVFSDVAVVRGTMRGIVGLPNGDIAIDNLFLTVWRRDSDAWCLIAHQTVAAAK